MLANSGLINTKEADHALIDMVVEQHFGLQIGANLRKGDALAAGELSKVWLLLLNLPGERLYGLFEAQDDGGLCRRWGVAVIRV